MGNSADSVQEDAQNVDRLGIAAGLISGLLGRLDPNAELAPATDEDALDYVKRCASIAGEKVDALNEELASTRRQLAAQKGQTTKARNEAATMAAELPAKPRRIDAAKYAPYDADDLVDLIEDADDVQILFSDGRQELAGIPPASISGKAWRAENGRVILTAPSLEVTGGGTNVQQLVAYALMIDGEIVAVKDRPEPLSIRPGQKYQLANDVIF